MSKNVPAHPNPAEDLNERELPLTNQSGPWLRIHRSKYGTIHFARDAINRFDDSKKEYGVLYCAQDFYGAFIETLGWSTGFREISKKSLSARRLASITSIRPLRFVNLTASGLAHIGADAEICTGRDRYLSQMWSRALWAHPDHPDGISYISRHDPQRVCYALFERTASELHVEDLGQLDEASLNKEVGQIINYYKFALIN